MRKPCSWTTSSFEVLWYQHLNKLVLLQSVFLLEHVLPMFTSHLLICYRNLRLLPFYCRLRNAVQYFDTVGGRYNSLMAVYIPRLSFFLKLY